MKVDTEKVLEGLEHCYGTKTGRSHECKGCPYDGGYKDEMNCGNLERDAYAVIKSQKQIIKDLTAEYDSMAKSVNEASKLIRSLKSRIRRLEAYDEQRDIALHTRLIDETRVDTTSKIFEEIDILVDDWKHSRIQSIQFIAELSELKKKYIKDVK